MSLSLLSFTINPKASIIEKWRNRDLSAENIKYIYLDSVNFSMRIKKIQTVPIPLAIGVALNGYRSVLGFQSGDKESASSWRQFFKDLKRRGLKQLFR
ncbi:MAG: transposase [Deltaproteobacteria bacterium]|nr:transposase [Deltaproteobacteria bacterium]